MNLAYHWEGDYLIPDLVSPESPKIGIWGERRRHFLRKHQKPMYDAMLMRGTLNAHLEEIDHRAEEMMNRLTVQLVEQEGITESLKATDQLVWLQKMNSLQECAKEIILKCLITTI